MSVIYSTGLYSILRQMPQSTYSTPTKVELGLTRKEVFLRSTTEKQSGLIRPVTVRRYTSPVGAATRVFTWRSRILDLHTPRAIGLTVRVTKNNIFIVAYTITGKNLFWLTRGRYGYKFNLYTVINVSLIRLMFGTALDILTTKHIDVGPMVHCLTIRGRVPTKRLLKDLRAARFLVRNVRISQPLPHNGCRLPHRRRGARN